MSTDIISETETLGDPETADAVSTTANRRRGEELLLGKDSEQQPTLSVVMPTLNEQQGIRETIHRIKSAIGVIGVPAEIIISDSSTDRTPEIATEEGAIVVEPERGGYGYAYRYAFDHARGDYIAIGDADTTYDFAELPKLLHRLIETDSDMVLGSRLDGEIKPGAMPNLHQYIGNPLLTRFLNVFYNAGVSDAHSGFRVMKREALAELDLEANGMEFASEMIMQASIQGWQIEEVPITYYQREGEATLDSFRDGWRHVKFMLLNAPGYLFLIPSGLLITAGLVLMLFGVSGYEIQSGAVRPDPLSFGTRSMVVGSLLTIVGFQIGNLGVFAIFSSDPIRQPGDRIQQWMLDRLRLQTGATVGLLLLAGGLSYAAYLIFVWATAGYSQLPPLAYDIATFTAIVVGIQTIFNAFFFSAIMSS